MPSLCELSENSLPLNIQIGGHVKRNIVSIEINFILSTSTHIATRNHVSTKEKLATFVKEGLYSIKPL